MVNPLHLPNPQRTFNIAIRDINLSLHRPLTEKDYFEATFHSKYQKRYRDGRMMGTSYILRHSEKKWKAGKKKEAVLQASLLPFAGFALVASTMMLGFPGGLAMAIQKAVPPKRRSEEGTREDVVGKAVFRLSRIVNCLAGSQQYHDRKRTVPVTQRELFEMDRDMQALALQMEYSVSQAPSRIAKSKNLAISFRYLEEMREQLHKRKFQDLPFT